MRLFFSDLSLSSFHNFIWELELNACQIIKPSLHLSKENRTLGGGKLDQKSSVINWSFRGIFIYSYAREEGEGLYITTRFNWISSCTDVQLHVGCADNVQQLSTESSFPTIRSVTNILWCFIHSYLHRASRWHWISFRTEIMKNSSSAGGAWHNHIISSYGVENLKRKQQADVPELDTSSISLPSRTSSSFCAAETEHSTPEREKGQKFSLIIQN